MDTIRLVISIFFVCLLHSNEVICSSPWIIHVNLGPLVICFVQPKRYLWIITNHKYIQLAPSTLEILKVVNNGKLIAENAGLTSKLRSAISFACSTSCSKDTIQSNIEKSLSIPPFDSWMWNIFEYLAATNSRTMMEYTAMKHVRGGVHSFRESPTSQSALEESCAQQCDLWHGVDDDD